MCFRYMGLDTILLCQYVKSTYLTPNVDWASVTMAETKKRVPVISVKATVSMARHRAGAIRIGITAVPLNIVMYCW